MTTMVIKTRTSAFFPALPLNSSVLGIVPPKSISINSRFSHASNATIRLVPSAFPRPATDANSRGADKSFPADRTGSTMKWSSWRCSTARRKRERRCLYIGTVADSLARDVRT